MKTYNGVRAEPTFLRDPTSFESFSTGIGKISSYVVSNLPKKRPDNLEQSNHQKFLEEIVVEEQVEQDKDTDTVTFAAFDKLSQHVSCLLLGYGDGFQLWNITSPDNVHEICSIRDKDTFGIVSCIHLLRQTAKDTLIAIVTEDNKKSKLIIYSIKTYSVVKEITDLGDGHQEDPVLITRIQSNHKTIALACLSRHKSFIHLLSATDFEPLTSPLLDVYHDIYKGPIFTLGSRFIAYSTNTAVFNKDPVMTSLGNKLQVEKDVKGAAKDIAKEVVSGMKSLGELGYHQLSNYFGTMPNTPISSPISADKDGMKKTTAPSGMVMIRDICKLPKSPSKNLSHSVVAHFRPYTHPISHLTFNHSGTLLLSASKQGHTFHIFSILTNTRSHGNVAHIYSLSRGYTDAQVEDCQFSIDSNWCAISTARGTTHLYAINPYGGSPEISGHVLNKVNNSVHRYSFMNKAKKNLSTTTLNPILRIKQRKRMPEDRLEMNDLLRTNRLQGEPRARLTTMFVNSKSCFVQSKNDPISHAMKGQQTSQMLRHISYISQAHDPLIFGFDEEYESNEDTRSQDIFTFHPSGTLTLHRCWISRTLAKGREVADRLGLCLKKESVAEWKVARQSDWNQVQLKMEEGQTRKEKKDDRKLFWLSNAEITTYVSEGVPIWSQPQFIFQTFKEESLNKQMSIGLMPATDTLVMPKEMPEPVSSRIDRVRKTNTRTERGSVEENMDDALAELEDNLSNAMQTSFSLEEPASSSPAKWLSTSANAISNNYTHKLNNRNSSVSFEDAYLINLGSGPSSELPVPESLQRSSLIQLDNDMQRSSEEDIIRFETDTQNDLYSFDGDNEAAYPYESVFEGFHTNKDGWQ